MSLDKAISMEPVKEKLRNLQEYMPNKTDIIYRFGEYLADRLNPELVPQGFCMTIELVLHDLEKGVDGVSKQPIRNGPVGYPPQIYALLRMQIPDIVEAVCPEDFAKGVKEFYEKINEKIKKE